MQAADICRANKDTFGEVRTFYHSLTDNLNPERRYVGWKKDIYPSPEFLRTSIDNGCLYICRDKERIAGAMVLNHDYNESYKNCHWHTAVDDSELLVIHALGVHPDYHRKGYAKALVRHSIAIAREAGMKTIRLDVLDGNIPAENGVGQGLAGAARYVVVYRHGFRNRIVLGIILGGDDDLMPAVLRVDDFRGDLRALGGCLRDFIHRLAFFPCLLYRGCEGRFHGILRGLLGHRHRIGVLNTRGRSFCAKLIQNSLLQQAGVPWYNPYIITAYAPSPEKWEAYWKTRKEEIK